IFTRTPLHVGAGSSVGAIDMPVQRERHTGFPIIPGSGIKGVFADAWSDQLAYDDRNKLKRKDESDIAWLFGSEDSDASFAGSLLFSEARLLAFPIRSLVGGFAWITCPHILKRAVRDGALTKIDGLEELVLKDN